MRIKYSMIIEIACLLALAFVTIYTITAYMDLPAKVPMHFNARGEVDSYGGKGFVYIMLGIIYFFYGMLSLVQRIPADAYNYAVAITTENRQRQYSLVKNFLITIKLELILTFIYLQYSIIQGAYGRFTLGSWFLIVDLVAIFGSLTIYIIISIKQK